MVGDAPYFVGNALERFMRDFLCITFVSHVREESYIIASVLPILQHLILLPQGSLKCLLPILSKLHLRLAKGERYFIVASSMFNPV